MKRVDVRSNVMQTVVRYEKKRTTSWYIRFFVLLVGLLFALGGVLYWVMTILAERQSFELLSLFSEDREIIAEFWQDTVMIFLEELPRRPLVLAFLLFVLIVALWLVTMKRRKRLAKIRRQLETYDKRR